MGLFGFQVVILAAYIHIIPPTEDEPTPSKQSKLSELDMAAKIQELEAKYESLKNNSMKLAAAVINSEKVPDEAKNIINEIEKN